jgi:uncharacterized membrane protein
MDERELRERVQAMEARLAHVEHLLGLGAKPPMEPAKLATEPPALPPRATVQPAATLVPPPGVPAQRPALHIPTPRTPTAHTATPRASSPHARAAAAREKRADLERFFGLTVLGRVGIAALLLAGAYFGQLGWAHLGPTARAAVVYLAGGALIGVGVWLRPRVAARYTATLWGGGLAMTYLAGVLAHLVFGVMSSTVALVSLFATVAIGQYLARVLALEAFATVALGGAYMAPVLVGTPSGTPTAFFTLLLALHTWAAWTEHLWRWLSARVLAAGATAALVIAWYGQHGPVSAWSVVLHVEAMWLGLIAPELLAALRRAPVSVGRARAIGLAGLVAQWCLVQCLVTAPLAQGPEALSGFGLVAGGALLAGGAALVPFAEALGSWIARAGSAVLPFGVLQCTLPVLPVEGLDAGPRWRCLGGLVAVAAVLPAVRRWTRVAELGGAIAAVLALPIAYELERGATPLAVAAGALLLITGRNPAARTCGLLTAVSAAFFGLAPLGPLGGLLGAWMALALAVACGVATLALVVGSRVHDRVLAAIAVAAEATLFAVWIYSALYGRSVGEPMTPLWNVRTGSLLAIVAAAIVGTWRLPAAEQLSRAVLGTTALVGVYVAGLLELLDAVAGWRFGPRSIASSIYTLAYASALLTAGFRRRMPALRWTALAAFGAVAVKIVAWDLREVETPLRVLATAVLGAVLLVVAWAYARRTQRVGAAGDPGPDDEALEHAERRSPPSPG